MKNYLLKHYSRKFSPELKSAATLIDYLKVPYKDRYNFGFYRLPYSLEWGEWSKFKEWTKLDHPIQYFFRETVGGYMRHKLHSLDRMFYWLKCKIWYKYNVIKLDCDPTWVDISEKIRLVNFQLLCDYVEKEMKTVMWDEEPHKTTAQNIHETYDYIKIGRPTLLENIDKQLELGYSCDIDDVFSGKEPTKEQTAARESLEFLEKQLKDLDEKHLINIIKVREYLWS